MVVFFRNKCSFIGASALRTGLACAQPFFDAILAEYGPTFAVVADVVGRGQGLTENA